MALAPLRRSDGLRCLWLVVTYVPLSRLALTRHRAAPRRGHLLDPLRLERHHRLDAEPHLRLLAGCLGKPPGSCPGGDHPADGGGKGAPVAWRDQHSADAIPDD